MATQPLNNPVDAYHCPTTSKDLHSMQGPPEAFSQKGNGDKTRLTNTEPRGGMPGLGVKSVAQLKCNYTNAHSMGNKQEELEARVQQEISDRNVAG